MLKLLLAPFALLYGLAVKVRNILFDLGILKSRSYTFPLVCVGNLTVGGTGKTPHIELLIRHLSKEYSVAVLSRGYKRKSNGFLAVEPQSNATQVGDEPLQIKCKYPLTEVAVSESRVKGVDQLLELHPNLDVILLDDAFQHRSIEAGYNILLTDYSNLITKDYFLPLGTLRDSLAELHRANCMIVTKCPHGIKPIDQRIISKELNLMPYQQLYFSTMVYGELTPVFQGEKYTPETNPNIKVLALSGIANPQPFISHIESEWALADKLIMPDHATLTDARIKTLVSKFEGIESDSKMVITTEKDAARLRSISNLPNSIRSNIFYIPIEVQIVGDKSQDDFLNRIQRYVRKSKKDGSIYTS